MSYESPIKVIYDYVQTKAEEDIIKAVQNVGIVVNAIELRKALMYDRKQYTQGFEDGKKFAEQELIRHGHWVKPKGMLWDMGNCSVCGEFSVEGEKALYCPHCGARMDEVTE